MQKIVWLVLFVVVVAVIVWLVIAAPSSSPSPSASSVVPPPQADKVRTVFVSIPPLKYIAEKIGGDRVTIRTMVRPGANPHTFEPLPDQMAALSEAAVFFSTGDPSERAWMDKVRASYPRVAFIATDEAILKRRPDGAPEEAPAPAHDCAHHAEQFTAEDHAACPNFAAHHGGIDPHVWLAPRQIKLQARSMAATLGTADKEHAGLYKERLDQFERAMDALDAELRALLAPFKGRSFVVFHPSWGYFADEYGLKQIPIEASGKEPGAAYLARVIDIAKREKAAAIFVSPQFPSREAQAVADAAGARVVTLDPMAEDVAANLRAVGAALAGSFGGGK